MNKVVIVGCGNVGMAYAYSLVISGSFVDELVLIDINKQKAEGEALDLNHAVSYAPKNIKIKAGDYSDCEGAKIVCISAGVPQLPGETRTDLLAKNADVFCSIIKQIKKTSFNGIFLIATNPLDTMTYITKLVSQFPENKVFGSGTTLDTARLKFMVADILKINAKDVHGYVLGEHGDSEFVAWNNVFIGGNSATNWLSQNDMSKINYDVKNSAYDIINKKGNTAYGIGMCLLGITDAILNDEKKILTVSCYSKEHDCYFSKPCIIGKRGVEKQLNIDLSPKDNARLLDSIAKLQDDKRLIVARLRNQK